MFAVFYTVRASRNQFVDHYIVCESRSKATQLYNEVLGLDSTHCAGISTIVTCTEPQWMDDEDESREAAIDAEEDALLTN
jgi:hypothetical protein